MMNISGELGVGNSTDGGESLVLTPTEQYLRLFLGYLQQYYVPALVLLGSAGNILSVFVFFATKLRKLSSSYYLSALATSDTGFLLTLFIAWLSMVDVPFFTMPVICQMTIYLSTVCSFLSVWFVVAFTVERFIAVLYPLKRPSVCTVARARFVLAVLTILSLLTFSPYLIMAAPQKKVDINNNRTILVCDLQKEYHDLANLFMKLDFIFTLILPFCLIVTLNTLIGRTVWKLATVRRGMTQSKKSAFTAGELNRHYLTHHHQQNSSNVHHNSSSGGGIRPTRRRSPSSQTKVTEMLLMVSTVFIILNLPSYLMRIWTFATGIVDGENQNRRDTVIVVILQHYFNVLFNTNFGINFALYCVSGQNFRRALVSLFCSKPRRPTENTTITGLTEYSRQSVTLRRRTGTANNGVWQDGEQLMATCNEDTVIN